MLNQIGRYKIEKVLGSGGMATVYLGFDPFEGLQIQLGLCKQLQDLTHL